MREAGPSDAASSTASAGVRSCRVAAVLEGDAVCTAVCSEPLLCTQVNTGCSINYLIPLSLTCMLSIGANIQPGVTSSSFFVTYFRDQ